MKVNLTIEVVFDKNLYGKITDKDERDWFFNNLVKDELILHSNFLGETVGPVKIITVGALSS